MPYGDGTGPAGMGPGTGWGRGPCGGGMRRRFRRGWGRGWRISEPVELTKEEQEKILKAELEEIGLEKKEIEKKLKEMQ